MVAQENVKLIVTTCNVVERGVRKCEKFWPELNTKVQAMDEGCSIVYQGEQKLSQHCFKRTFLFNDPNHGCKDQVITQLHYTGWPDHDVPRDDAMVSFGVMLFEFIEWLLKSNTDEKAVVHCSAGIGRTGTTICLAHAIVNIWA